MASEFEMTEYSSFIPSQAGSTAGSREIDLPSLTLVEYEFATDWHNRTPAV